MPDLALRGTHAGSPEGVPPHLAAAQQALAAGGCAKSGAVTKPVRLGAVGRVRAPGLLNGAIPGSSAAAAAVSFYHGNAGAAWLLHDASPGAGSSCSTAV